MTQMAHLKQQKKQAIDMIREYLIARDYTSIELVVATGINMDNLRKYLREMTDGSERVYIASWFKDDGGKWNARYRFGNKPNAPRPLRSKATALRQERRARQLKPLTPEQRKRKTEGERQRRLDVLLLKGELTEEQEAALRARAFAKIKPRMDPWAHLFHGGAAVIAGASV